MEKESISRRVRRLLKELGSTNKARWKMFCPYDEITFTQFANRITQLGIPINPQEASEMWKKANIGSFVMKFEDFVKFLVFRNKAPIVQQIATAPSNIYQTKRDVLLNKLVSADQTGSGYISASQFEAISQELNVSRDEANAVFHAYDTRHNNTMNYFLFLSDLNSPSTPKKSYTNPDLLEKTGQLINKECPWMSPPRSPGFGGRGPVDPEIFPTVASSIRQNSQKQLEEKCNTETQSPSKQLEYQEPYTSPKKTPTRDPPPVPNDLVISISKCVQEKEAQTFFQQHQTAGLISVDFLCKLLGIESASNGDFMEVREIYGDPLTVSSFLRLTTDGSKIPKRTYSLASCDQEVVFKWLAKRVINKSWKGPLLKCRTSKEASDAFRNIGVYIWSSDLGSMVEDLGIIKFVEGIEENIPSQ